MMIHDHGWNNFFKDIKMEALTADPDNVFPIISCLYK